MSALAVSGLGLGAWHRVLEVLGRSREASPDRGLSHHGAVLEPEEWARFWLENEVQPQ